MNSSQNPSGKIFYVTYVMKSMRCIFLMELLENFLSVVSILTVKKRIFVVEEADDRPILGKTVERWEPILLRYTAAAELPLGFPRLNCWKKKR